MDLMVSQSDRGESWCHMVCSWLLLGVRLANMAPTPQLGSPGHGPRLYLALHTVS